MSATISQSFSEMPPFNQPTGKGSLTAKIQKMTDNWT